MEQNNYLAVNKQSWNNRLHAHYQSDFYDVKGFIEGGTSLKEIELQLLGDIKGKRILHLQCHFGQDSIALARMGAVVTAVDLSDQAIDQARILASECGQEVTFICCNIFDLPNYLSETFDLVFTSYGVITWLPDLNLWAELIAQYLKPQGQLIFVEFHPVLWMYDDNFKHIQYSYFNAAPIVEVESGTYAEVDAPIEQGSITWNHSISDVLNSLIGKGLQINSFDELNYSPYNCFEQTVEFEPGKFRIEPFQDKVPMVFAVSATLK